MVLIYNIGIRVYHLAILLACLWNEKARKWIAGRKTGFQHFAKHDEKSIWFHCASVGEFEQAQPLIALCKARNPESPILITFFSPSGYEYASKKYPDDRIAYLPLDTKNGMREFISKANPRMVFVIKYEFWYHMLQQLHQQGIPIFLVAGIFRREQLFFNSLFGFFSHLFVQNEQSKSLLDSIHVHEVTVGGDTRFDRVAENKKADFADAIIDKFIATDKVLVAGSVWNSDIPVLKSLIDSLPQDWKFIIAPHEVNHFDTSWISEATCSYQNSNGSPSRILILDIVGILSKVYRYANFVYVGGGFGKGIHNILEPAVYSKPILFGPNYLKSQEAVDLLELQAAFIVNAKKVGNLIKETLLDKNNRALLEKKINAYMSANTYLSEKIWVYVSRYLAE